MVKLNIVKEYKFDIENTDIKGKWTGIFKELSNGNVEFGFIEKYKLKILKVKLLSKPYLKTQ